MNILLLWMALAGAAQAEKISFARQVRPVLAERCGACHSARNASGGLAVESVAQLLRGGKAGAAVKAGKPDASPLVAYVSGPKPLMPKMGAPLSAAQVATLRQWVLEGAVDDTPAGAKDGVWWSAKPLLRVTPPGGGNAIDAFVRARLAAAGLQASPEADKRTLIRRLTFDLHGLPPAVEEVEAFVADASPQAYEKLVDRLLASPRYGERWARHWLDVVHYGDSHGYDKDKPRANAWRYRDWVIRALNADKPYAAFVEEQIAGDVLRPLDAEAVTATGFLAAGPWDFVGHQELAEGTTDKNITRLLDRDDMVAQTMSTFVSQTVHCARCHDHKFDPIAQEDYYSVQAVFAGIDRAERPIDRDARVAEQRRTLLERKRAVQLELQPWLDKVDGASSKELDQLDFRIKDARSLIVHIGEPKTEAEAAEKARLQAQWEKDTKRRKQLVDAHVGAHGLAEIARLSALVKQVDAELEQLPKPEMVYAAANFFTRMGNFRPALKPRPVHVLERGNIGAPKQEAKPGAIGVRFDVEGGSEGQRRLALARWITAKENALAWRSIVNRVWHYHFGAGIVDTPSDFGRMGSQPTHPELLDWLAVWFRDEARGSWKALHKQIVMSATYRQTSAARADGMKVDADNRLLWRMNRTRLDAESVRDAMLAVSGRLDLTMGGPAVRQFFFKDDHSPVYDYARFDVESAEGKRRSVYRFLVRSVPDPFMDRLDCPDASLLTPKRSTTLTAIQALALLNNPLVLKMAEHFTARLEKAGGAEQRAEMAYRLALGRRPGREEAALLAGFAARQGWVNASRLLFNSNEFLFVD